MKYLYILLPLVLLSCKTNISTVNENSKLVSKPIEIAYKVDESKVSEFLKYLSSDELEGRETGTIGIEKAAVFLEDFLKNNNIKPYFKSYRDTLTNFKSPAYNIVGVLEGSDPVLKNEFVVLSAHYDHIGLDKTKGKTDVINNGANDDASGVTAVAEIAKYFSKTKSNKRSILIVFFAGEEKGLLGSKSLVQKLKKIIVKKPFQS